MNDNWNERLKIVAGSRRTRRNAAKKREFSQKPFLPIISPIIKRPIIMNDLTAGMLAPERPRYASMNGRHSKTAVCDGVRKMVNLCNILYGSALMLSLNNENKNKEKRPK